jgi:hypothetical protein
VYFFPFVVILAPAFEQDWPLVTALAGATAIVVAAKSPRVEIKIALRNIKTSVEPIFDLESQSYKRTHEITKSFLPKLSANLR